MKSNGSSNIQMDKIYEVITNEAKKFDVRRKLSATT